MKRTLCLITLLLALAIAGFADSPPMKMNPQKTPAANKEIDGYLQIMLKREAKDARLIIPKDQLNELRAALGEIDRQPTAAVTMTSFTRTQTVVSGMFLSLALAFGGIWFVRSGKAATTTGKTLVILAVTAGICSAATFVFANVGPPQEARTINGKMFSPAVHEYKQGSGPIKIEVSDEVQSVTLIVPDPAPAPGGTKRTGEE
jgi:hypothetical protein